MKKTKRRELSPLQKACLAYGSIHWTAANTHALVRYLLEHGMDEEAAMLVEIRSRAIDRSKEVYYRERKRLQPDWEPTEDDELIEEAGGQRTN